MSETMLSRELARRITMALRSGHLPPVEFQRLAEDIEGDQRVAALRASIFGQPDETIVGQIDLKKRYLAVRYDEWLNRVEEQCASSHHQE